MKQFIIIAFALFFSCIALSAQTSNLTSKGVNVFQDDVKLSSEQLMSILPGPNYNQYARARKMNIGGNVSLIVGSVATVGGAAMAVAGYKLPDASKGAGEAIAGTLSGMTMFACGVSLSAIGVAGVITGAVLKGCASSRVKKAISVGNNGGIAYNF